MSNPVDVIWYSSTLPGAPSLSGQSGKLIGVLDACLVNGFGSQSINTLSVTSGVATATVSAGHGLPNHCVQEIAGATPSGLNGKKRITYISATQFSFDATGIADGTATGTITTKTPGAGYTKVFAGTNKAVYRADEVTSTRLYLRVDDTGTTYARVRGYEAMSDIDTGTGPFPTDAQVSGGLYHHKSSSADSTGRAWTLIADKAAFYIFNTNGAAYFGQLFFGDLAEAPVPGDAYCCGLICNSTSTQNSGYLASIDGTSTAAYLPRAATQIGTAVAMPRYGHKSQAQLGAAGMPYPGPGNQAFFTRVEAWDSGLIRGIMPGLYSPLHALSSIAANTTIAYTSADGSSRNMLCLRNDSTSTNNDYRAAIDITGPWRE